MTDRQFGIDLDNHITGEPDGDFAENEQTPLTCEALADLIEATGTDWEFRQSSGGPSRPLADEQAEAILSRFSLPAPAECDLAATRNAALEEAAGIAERYNKGYAQHPDDKIVELTQMAVARIIREAKEGTP